ncbi:MAG TPA: DMT family transporter [Thermoplasmatales archaeon]|nr:DMT family transporter [Thermoplasmatales archaeon]
MTWIYLLLAFVSLLWGGSFVVVKDATALVSPINLAFIRFLVASPIMIILLFLSKKPKHITVKDFGWFALLGLSGVTLLYLLQYTGIYLTNASNASVLINTNVLFIALLATVFLKEKMSVKRVLGISIAFGGVFIVTTGYSISVSGNALFGSLLVILSALCWAIYSIVGRHLMTRYDEFILTTYAFAFGTIFFLPFLDFNQMGSLLVRSSTVWFSIFYLSVLCSVFGYTVWYYGLSKMDASKIAVFLNLIPLSAILFSVFLLHETLTIQFIIGALLILSGVYITQKG